MNNAPYFVSILFRHGLKKKVTTYYLIKIINTKYLTVPHTCSKLNSKKSYKMLWIKLGISNNK